MAVETPERFSLGRPADADAPAFPRVSVLPAPGEKHRYVQAMFDAIAPRYDLLNSVLSLRLHHGWRRVAADEAALLPGDVALDVCTGTGDLAFELTRRVGPEGRVIASDFSLPMLRLGEQKRQTLQTLRFALADTQNLPFASYSFDAVTVGFGIRNVADIKKGLAEMTRVVRHGGRVVILEFNQPRQHLFAVWYQWYSFTVLPCLGGLLSGRRAAYEYLPSSVAAFPSREALQKMMERAGLTDIRIVDLFFGTVVVHRGVKQGEKAKSA